MFYNSFILYSRLIWPVNLFQSCEFVPQKKKKKNYLVSNDTMSAVSKFNKCETCQQKITTPLTNKRHVLMDSYFLHTCLLFIRF